MIIDDQHYDMIIVGTGAGGGTLAYKLAPTDKKILYCQCFASWRSLNCTIALSTALRKIVLGAIALLKKTLRFTDFGNTYLGLAEKVFSLGLGVRSQESGVRSQN